MSSKYTDFELFMKRILERVSVLKARQLELCLSRYYSGVDIETARELILKAQKRGLLLLTEDGYVLTKGAYFTLTGAKKDTDIKYEDDIRIKNNIGHLISDARRDIIDCMWIVANMMPDADSFTVSCGVWPVQFITDAKGETPAKLFQVIRVRKEKEIPVSIMLRSIPDPVDASMREQVRRIVILDDENFAWRFPKVGISHIAVLDENEPNGFTVIEKRKPEEAWIDHAG